MGLLKKQSWIRRCKYFNYHPHNVSILRNCYTIIKFQNMFISIKIVLLTIHMIRSIHVNYSINLCIHTKHLTMHKTSIHEVCAIYTSTLLPRRFMYAESYCSTYPGFIRLDNGVSIDIWNHHDSYEEYISLQECKMYTIDVYHAVVLSRHMCTTKNMEYLMENNLKCTISEYLALIKKMVKLSHCFDHI